MDNVTKSGKKYSKYLLLKQASCSIVLSSESRILHVGMIQEVEDNFKIITKDLGK